MTALRGVLCFGSMAASAFGNTPARPNAKAVRVNTLAPAFALAIVELMIAKRTRIQKMVPRPFARPSHGAPLL